MKIDRQLAILAILLQREQVSAPALAERLEVSRRTITRDIDDLCRAGFPIATRQGAGGGISIAEGFKLDKSLLTENDLDAIATGLRGLDPVYGAASLRLLDKLRPPGAAQGHVEIDLTSHYRDSLSEKLALLRTAAAGRRLVRFRYYAPHGSGLRTVEPHRIVYKWTDWYLLAHCRDRQDFRLFKLRRLWEAELLEEGFPPREIPPEQRDLDNRLPDHSSMAVLFDPEVEYLLVEEYGPDSYERRPDGKLLHRHGFTHFDYALRWVLQFGAAATVLEPAELRDAVREQARRILQQP